ncbi:MAG TPA: putative zinc-binding protein [Candidatus Cloacimonadota bacterium]|nr:putative zinc-binding protein [Candidatus Cloacimonadota bacterium]
MAEKNTCACSCDCGSDTGDCVTNSAPVSVYACCGASNVGVISYELSKALHKENRYKLGCATCIGAGDCSCGGTVTEDGKKDLLIDGCKTSCLKKMFEKNGIKEFNHVIITQMGVKKEPTFEYEEGLIGRLLDILKKKGL